MANAIYSPDARADLRESIRFIGRDSPAAARRWAARIRKTRRLLADNPQIGERRPQFMHGCRSFSIGNYVIFFRAVPTGIEVLRIVRGERDLKRL